MCRRKLRNFSLVKYNTQVRIDSIQICTYSDSINFKLDYGLHHNWHSYIIFNEREATCGALSRPAHG